MSGCNRLLSVAILLFPLCAALAAEAPHALLTEESYDFGTVKQGVRVVHVFTVKNINSVALRIERADLSMPGMTARFKPDVPPGSVGTVTIEWVTDRVVGPVQGEARLSWNDPARREATVIVKGVVTPPISIEPIPAVFLSLFKGEKGERLLRVVNNEERPVAVTRVETGPHVVASLSMVKPGKVFKVTVRPAPDVAVGRYEESLTLKTDNPAASEITLPVHLFVKADLYADPDAVDFGAVRLDQARTPRVADLLAETLLVKRREGSFEITSVACDLPAVAVRRLSEGASDSFEVDVHLRPETLRPGRLEGRIRISTSDPRFPELVVPVQGEVL